MLVSSLPLFRTSRRRRCDDDGDQRVANIPIIDALGGPIGVGNFSSLCLFSNFPILCINPLPMPNQAASQANWPTVEVFEANNLERAESK